MELPKYDREREGKVQVRDRLIVAAVGACQTSNPGAACLRGGASAQVDLSRLKLAQVLMKSTYSCLLEEQKVVIRLKGRLGRRAWRQKKIEAKAPEE